MLRIAEPAERLVRISCYVLLAPNMRKHREVILRPLIAIRTRWDEGTRCNRQDRTSVLSCMSVARTCKAKVGKEGKGNEIVQSRASQCIDLSTISINRQCNASRQFYHRPHRHFCNSNMSNQDRTKNNDNDKEGTAWDKGSARFTRYGVPSDPELPFPTAIRTVSPQGISSSWEVLTCLALARPQQALQRIL